MVDLMEITIEVITEEVTTGATMEEVSWIGLLGVLTLGAIASQGVGYGGYPYPIPYPVSYSTQYPAPYPYSGYPY